MPSSKKLYAYPPEILSLMHQVAQDAPAGRITEIGKGQYKLLDRLRQRLYGLRAALDADGSPGSLQLLYAIGPSQFIIRHQRHPQIRSDKADARRMGIPPYDVEWELLAAPWNFGLDSQALLATSESLMETMAQASQQRLMSMDQPQLTLAAWEQQLEQAVKNPLPTIDNQHSPDDTSPCVGNGPDATQEPNK